MHIGGTWDAGHGHGSLNSKRLWAPRRAGRNDDAAGKLGIARIGLPPGRDPQRGAADRHLARTTGAAGANCDAPSTYSLVRVAGGVWATAIGGFGDLDMLRSYVWHPKGV
ncbi:hypothetical protein EVG20_g5431 [Dentipellis fragilis]|uniref:Uncharacterized protein n=1 Tax=Dentipellis fragilis TaxID=205917 RepID=A0A4Y9YV82_9AGAM|nr:hypothetical protein EVG20_g5431 [Dentipellis fragilis]